MNKNKSDPMLIHIQRDPLAIVFTKFGQSVVVPLPVEAAQILAYSLLEIPEVAGTFNEIAEELVIQKLQMQQPFSIN